MIISFSKNDLLMMIKENSSVIHTSRDISVLLWLFIEVNVFRGQCFHANLAMNSMFQKKGKINAQKQFW